MKTVVRGRTGSSAALCLVLSLTAASAAAATTWNVSKTKNAAEGCNENRDTAVCILIRCDAPRRLATYFQVVEGDPFSDRIRMTMDGRAFKGAVALPVVHDWGTAWTVRTSPDGFVASLRHGRRLTLKGADITGGFDVFALGGAKAAIDQVERRCGLTPPD